MARERLDKALFRVAKETDVDELRLRRWVSFLALCGVLQRAIDEGVITDYHLKGGAALELRFRQSGSYHVRRCIRSIGDRQINCREPFDPNQQ
jgi:hypothetical protein